MSKQLNIPEGFVRCAIHEMRNWYGIRVDHELIEKAILADTNNHKFYKQEFEMIDYENLDTARITYGLDTVPREYLAESLGLYLTKQVWPTYREGNEAAQSFFSQLESALDDYWAVKDI